MDTEYRYGCATLVKSSPFEVMGAAGIMNIGAIVLARGGSSSAKIAEYGALLDQMRHVLLPGGVLIARSTWWTCDATVEHMRAAGFADLRVIGRILWDGDDGFFESAAEPWIIARKRRARAVRPRRPGRFGSLIVAPPASSLERRIGNSALSQQFLRELLLAASIPRESVVLEPWATSCAVAAACAAQRRSAIAIFADARAHRRAVAALPALTDCAPNAALN